MKIKLDKAKLSNIDNAFKVLKENTNIRTAIETIESNLKDAFGADFKVKILDPIGPNKALFVMSVLPELSTIDKIVNACMSDKNIDTIKSLWADNKLWTIEIDQRLFDTSLFNFTEREFTAILLHEIGHIVCSNSLPTKISLILRYELISARYDTKAIMKSSLFSKILSLPILDACISDGKRDRNSIKEEIKADAFAKKMGYSNELLSVLNKLIKSPLYPKSNDINDKMKKSALFSIKNLEDFQARRDNLAKQSLFSLRESTDSEYIKDVINQVCFELFESDDESLSITSDNKVKMMQEKADQIVMESFGIFKKNLKRIDPTDIDYIRVKIQDIHSPNDKLMLISYLNSKLDIVQYYIDILNNPKYAKRYNVPYTMQQLVDLRNVLYDLKKQILTYKIPERNKNILVQWPDNYEG